MEFDEINWQGEDMIVAATPMRIGEWFVVLVQSKDALYASLYKTISMVSVAGYGIAAVFIALAYAAARRFVAPVKNISAVLEEIANEGGDLTWEISVRSNDELGVLVGAFNRFVATLRGLITDVGNTSETVNRSVEAVSAAVDVSAEQSDMQQHKTQCDLNLM